MYSTRQSLIDFWGEADISALAREQDGSESAARLNRALSLACAVIDQALTEGGYTLPLDVAPYNTPPTGTQTVLSPLLLKASDCLAVNYLSLAYNLKKDEFTLCKAETDAFLASIKDNSTQLPYPQELKSTTNTIVVSARRSLIDEPINRGCCGKRIYY